jgi:branched-chain amino acid aminotransferase
MVSTTLSIDIQKTENSRIHQVSEGLKSFGRVFSDHMFIADYKDGEWQKARIVPYGDIAMSPSISALHYGQSVFEGMKAFKNNASEVLLFRPEDNINRLNKSAHRLCMPELPKEIFMDGLKQLLSLDRNWISKEDGASLYIRPFMFATDEFIGVKPSETYRFIIFTNPVGTYYTEPVNVKVETKYTRAANGGVGFAKAAGNYAASLYPAKLAQEQGFHQLIWTDPVEHKYIEESGTMNLMVMIGNTLVTPVTSETILAGITRDSVIKVAKEWGYNIEERKISISEVIEAHKNGSLKEMFGMGTAATIAHIALFNFNDINYTLPAIEEREFSPKVSQYLYNVKRGTETDPFSWIEKI